MNETPETVRLLAELRAKEGRKLHECKFQRDAFELGVKLGFEPELLAGKVFTPSPLQRELLMELADLDKKQIKPVARRTGSQALNKMWVDFQERIREFNANSPNVLEANVSGISGLVEFKDVCYNKHKKSGLHCNRNKDHDGNHSTVPEAAIGVAKGIEWANLVAL